MMSASVIISAMAGLSRPMADRHFHFDARSAWIDGSRTLIMSGAIHYARVPMQDWAAVLADAKAMGLNAIQTYFMWNFHERERGVLDWTGRRNLTHFIQLAHDAGLFVTLRIGPYVCGEYQFGGIPQWMRTLDSIQCFRCSDPVWTREMARVVGTVVDRVRPQLASRGGPIIMLQIENEYNGADLPYLEWAVDMARNLTAHGADASVPWNLCHDHALCSKVNRRGANGSYAFNALCTINGFWMEEYEKNPSQPSPKWLADLRAANPGQPAIWTEDQGWFDKWKFGKRVRDSADQIYGVARWFALGGAWHNFYMLTGGNNYGLQAGGEVTTAYAPDTAIDNLLLRHEPRFTHYGRFFRALARYSDALLNNPIASTQCKAGGGVDKAQLWVYNASAQHVQSVVRRACKRPHAKGEDCFQCLDLRGGTDSIDLWDCKGPHDPAPANQRFDTTVKAAEGGIVAQASGLCLTAIAPHPAASAPQLHEYGQLAFLSNPVDKGSGSAGGGGLCEVTYRGGRFVLPPHTVVLVDTATLDVVYNTSDVPLPPSPAPPPSTAATPRGWSYWQEVAGCPDCAHVASAPAPREQLQVTEDATDYLWYVANISAAVVNRTASSPRVHVDAVGGTIAYASIIARQLQDGATYYELAVLSVAMGMSNGGVGPHTVKGIRNVTVNGVKVAGPFAHRWMMPPELASHSQHLPWTPITTQGGGGGGGGHVDGGSGVVDALDHVWFRAHVERPAGHSDSSQTAYALNLTSMNKGVAYVNGWHLGRYWLVPGECNGACAPPVKSGHCYEHWAACGQPTQTLYHVPTEVLAADGQLNEILLFEETANSNTTRPRDLSAVRLVALHAHPPAV